MRFILIKPTDCREQDIRAFHDLVLKGKQVNPKGLEERIRNAHLLAFCYDGETPVATMGLKNPGKKYKEKIFGKAGISKDNEKYIFEIGWEFTDESHRRKGISQTMMKMLLDASGNTPIFATAIAPQCPVRTMLINNGFEPVGQTYRNTNDGHLLQILCLH